MRAALRAIGFERQTNKYLRLQRRYLVEHAGWHGRWTHLRESNEPVSA